MPEILYAEQTTSLPAGPYLRKPVIMGLAPHLTPEQPAGIRVRVLNSLDGPMELLALHWRAEAKTPGCVLRRAEGTHTFDSSVIPLGGKLDITLPNAIAQRKTDPCPTAVTITVTAEARAYEPDMEVATRG